MDPSPSSTQAAGPFRFTLSPFHQGLRWVAVAGFGASALVALFSWQKRRDPSQALLLAFEVALLLLLWRRVLRPLPSEVEVDGGDLVFRNLPTLLLQIQGLEVPIVVRREVRVARTAMVLEWIDEALSWNDMENGRTVFLARGAQARALAAWMKSRGLSTAIEG